MTVMISSLNGQGVIRGSIFDEESGEPVIYANVSLDYDYESKPALDTAENDDLRLVVGLGLEF